MTALDSILRRLGLQPTPYRALVKVLVLMDLRCQHYGRSTGAKPDDLIPPLYWVLGQYLFISAIVSGVLFMRVSVEAYAFVNLAVAMILALTAVIVEFNEVVLDVEDIDVISPRPVAGRTYAAARMTNLAFYMLLVILSLTIFPAIMGCGLRDSGLLFLPCYALASVLGCAGIMWLAIILYSLAPPKRGAQDFRDLFAWAQIIVALVAFYGAQLLLRDSSHSIEMLLATPPDWLSWLPPTWLAEWTARATTSGLGEAEVRMTLAAALAVLLIGLLAVARMSAYYGQVQAAERGGGKPPSGSPRPLVGVLSRWLAGSAGRAAPLALCLLMLRRDQDLRLRSLPALATALVFLGLGWFLHELGDPFGDTSAKAGFPIAILGLVMFAVPSILHCMNYSRNHGAAWLFWAAPQPARVYAEAVRATVCYGILLPLLAGLTICFAVLWRDPWHGFLHGLSGWFGVTIASHLTMWGMGYPRPFSQPAARGAVTGPVVPYLAGIGTLAMALGVGEYYVARDPLLTALYVGGLAVLALASGQLPRLAARRKGAHV